jgi:hypothetical protein
VIASLNDRFDKVLAFPGVSDEVKPAIDDLKAKIAEVGQQSTPAVSRLSSAARIRDRIERRSGQSCF